MAKKQEWTPAGTLGAIIFFTVIAIVLWAWIA